MSNIDTHAGLSALVPNLNFVPVRKQAIVYSLHTGEVHEMPLLCYKINVTDNLEVVTFLPDGKEETRSFAKVGDVVMSGVFGEQYIVKANKFPKMYQAASEHGEIIPEQAPRQVAEVSEKELKEAMTFTASWGEEMILHPGDFLVKDDEGNVYRIERAAFLETYDWKA